MAPFDKHREYRATTVCPASDGEESAFSDGALLLENEQEAQLPYYVEVAGDYSIPHATAGPWASDETHDDQRSDDDGNAARLWLPKPQFRVKGA